MHVPSILHACASKHALQEYVNCRGQTNTTLALDINMHKQITLILSDKPNQQYFIFYSLMIILGQR